MRGNTWNWASVLGVTFGLTSVVGCGDSGDAPTYHRDVRPILEGRCTNCHQVGGIAPFKLDSYDAAAATAGPIKLAVMERRMPPWLAGEADVTYKHNPSLSTEQIDTLARWADSGAPEGDPNDAGESLEPVGGGIARVDLEISMPTEYTPQNIPDDYHCFAIPWEADTTQYVTGFNAIPGNTETVHHIAVYLIPPAFVEDLQGWDAAEEGPGYTCFGGPSGDKGSNIPTLLLSAWIPGYAGTTFPEGLGIKVEPGSYLALQMHYSSPNATPDPDKSTLQFTVTDQVERPAVYAPFLDIGWVLGGMDIPAGQDSVQHTITEDPRGFFELFIQDLDFSNGFEVHAAMFHMHKLGHKGQVSLLRQGEPARTLLNIDDWDFDWQQEYHLEQPAIFEDGDLMSLTCEFNNSAGNQPCLNGECRDPADVNWGEASDEEMCVVNMLITPR